MIDHGWERVHRSHLMREKETAFAPSALGREKHFSTLEATFLSNPPHPPPPTPTKGFAVRKCRLLLSLQHSTKVLSRAAVDQRRAV